MVFKKFSSVSLSHSVHPSLFLLLSSPRDFPFCSFAFLFGCFVHIFTPSWLCLSFYLIVQLCGMRAKPVRELITHTHKVHMVEYNLRTRNSIKIHYNPVIYRVRYGKMPPFMPSLGTKSHLYT